MKSAIVVATSLLVIGLSGVVCGQVPEADAGTSVVAVEHKRRKIYHSPQSPGFTCWTGMWSMPDRSPSPGATRPGSPDWRYS